MSSNGGEVGILHVIWLKRSVSVDVRDPKGDRGDDWRKSEPMRRFSSQAVWGLARNFARSGRGLDDGNLARESSACLGQNRRLSSTAGTDGKIVASVVLERLPVILPSLSPAVAAFRQFS